MSQNNNNLFVFDSSHAIQLIWYCTVICLIN